MLHLLQFLFHPLHGIITWMFKENKIHCGNVSEAFCLPDFVDLVIFHFYTIRSLHSVFYFENLHYQWLLAFYQVISCFSEGPFFTPISKVWTKSLSAMVFTGLI